MTPLYTTVAPEAAVNLMAKHFRQVVVDVAYYCITPIRFRADMVDNARVYFDKVPSQITAWQSSGGVLIRRVRRQEIGDYEAILFAECPRSVEFLDLASQAARWLTVVREPPTWRIHFETLGRRTARKSDRERRRDLDALERSRELLGHCDRFTPKVIDRLLHAHPGQIIPPSSVLESLVVSGRSSGTTVGAP